MTCATLRIVAIFLEQQVLTSRSDLHGFGNCEGYCNSATVQYKTQKIYFSLGLEHRLHRVDSEAKVSKQTNSICYISMTCIETLTNK